MQMHRHALSTLALTLTVGLAGLATPQACAEPTPTKWRALLNEEDRGFLEAVVDSPLPEFGKDLKVLSEKPLAREDLQGKVVVLQSWSSATSAGRKAPAALQHDLRQVASDDLLLLGLHTPDGAENADTYVAGNDLGMPILIDLTGEYSDALGVYKRPVNLVVDKHGTIRYAGLNARGLRKAVEELLAEEYDEAKVVEAAPAGKVAYPAHNKAKLYAKKNLQGQKGPQVQAEYWMTDQPEMSDKVMVVEFWATWCPPCRSSIPHLNELVDHFGDQIALVGISSEKLADFENGLEKYKLDLADFKYAVAVDPQGRSSRFVGVEGIPHTVVMSSDGVVRWQGMPQNLTEATLQAIVRADKAQRLGGEAKSGRWLKG
ncbi:MAG: redoxin domain-containing protein [Phycisphaerales bacterium JB038]